MGDPNYNFAQRNSHMEELRRLDSSIGRAANVFELKPIYERLEALSALYPGDDGMQSAISQVKSSMVATGQKLMESQGTAKTPSMLPTQAMPSASHSVPQSATAVNTPPGQIPAAQLDRERTAPSGSFTPGGGPIKPAPTPFNWKRAAIVGGVIGILVAAGGIYTVHNARKKITDVTLSTGNAPIAVKTAPDGASIRVNGEVKCTSDCQIELAPGTYEIQAVLPGYETVTNSLTVTAGTPANLNLTLQPLPLSVRLYTDLPAGKVTFDGQPYGDLQDSQLILDRVTPGKHTVKVASAANEVTFEFEASGGKQPFLTAPLAAKNILAILVANAGQNAKLYTSAANLKVSVDGNPIGDAGAAGLDLPNLQPGDRELSVTDGGTPRKLLFSVSAQPTLTAFLKLDINAGSIFVSTAGEDGVSIFLNNRELKTKSKNGQARLVGISVGSYMIKVAKEGFTSDVAQPVTVAKGQEARLEFKLKAIPKLAVLRLRGAAPGTQVLLDGNSLGTVAASGQLENTQIPPGEHALELRRERFAPKRIPRQFRAGETVELSGGDVSLAAAGGTLRLNVNPPNAQVTIKGPADATPVAVTGASLQLSEGNYVLTAKAANFADRTVNVAIASGETKTLDIALQPQSKKDANPGRRAGTMADFERAGEWVPQGGWSLHKGGNMVTYGITPTQGLFSFQIWRKDGRRLQWFVNATDAKNYVLFQLDKKNFVRKEIINGKDRNELKIAHKLPDTDTYNVQIEIHPNGVKTFLHDGTTWREVDNWSTASRTLTDGKFGLYIPGGDTFGLSNFRFVPR